MNITQAIIDLKHTLYVPTSRGYEPIKGAQEFLHTLEDAHFPHVFSVNSSFQSQEDLGDALSKSGLYIDLKKVVHPFEVSIPFLKKQEIDYVFIFSGNQSLPRIYQKAGLEVVYGYEPHMQGKGAVIVGYNPRFSGTSLQTAINYAWQKDAAIIALNGKNYRTLPRNKRTWDSLATAKLIAQVSEKQQVQVVGKPSEEYYSYILNNRLPSNDASSTVAIGDSPLFDLETPHKLGVETIFKSSVRRPRLAQEHIDIADHQVQSLEDIAKILGL